MSSPNEDQLLADLDQRAHAATHALDDAVERTAIPDFAAPSAPRHPRWISPISIAAGLLVVALIAAALVFSGGDDENTLAGEIGFTYLALPDPEALGYRVVDAFDGTEGRSGPQSDPTMDTVVTVQGPDDADDPWAEAVVSYSLPSEITTLDGESVDIGGPEATYTEEGAGPTVGWIDGDETRYLVSNRVDRDRLVELATAANDGSATGQRVLYSGGIGDLFPMALTTIGRGGATGVERTAIVAYASTTSSDELGMSVATTAGSGAQLRAASALATSTRDVTVRGHDAVLAEFFGSLLQVSWLEDDNTLARADAIGIDEDTFVDHLNQLEPVDPATFTDLADDTAPATALPGSEPRDTETSEAPVDQSLGSVYLVEGDVNYKGSLLRSSDGSLSLDASEETPSGSSGSSSSLETTEEPAVLRFNAANGSLLIVGVMPAGVDRVEIRDGDSIVEGSGPSTAKLVGPEATVFGMLVGPEFVDRDLTAVGTRSDGTEVSIEF